MSKGQKQLNIWRLIFETFPEGKEVCVLHENGKMYWGKFKHDLNVCKVGNHEFDWETIVFLCRGGFPWKYMKSGLTPEQLEEAGSIEDNDWLHQVLAQMSGEQLVKNEVVKKNVIAGPSPHHRFSVGFGCPYIMEDVSLSIVNPYGIDPEEVLMAESKDGAKGLLWDMTEHIIDFG